MNLLFFLTPKQDVLYIYEDFTLRQTLEKWANQRFATIPVLKRNGEYVGTITEGDILWGIKNLHGLDLEASEDVPISSFPRRYTVDDALGAAEAGVQPGDIILEADGQPVSVTSDLLTVRRSHSVGDTIRLTIQRDGQTLTVDVVLYASK